MGAGYTKDGTFVTPVIYVKDNVVDNWRGDEEGTQMYTYVDIYKMRLPSEYKNIVVKPIDSEIPKLTVNGEVVLTTSEELAQFDLMSYLTQYGVYTVSDDKSEAEDCIVYIQSVVNQNMQEVASSNGKYNLRAVGTYAVLLVAED